MARATSAFDRFATAAGVIVLAIGGVVLIGWALNVRTLQSFYPGWVTMKANTAFGLTLSALALLVHSANQQRSRRAVLVARGLAGIVAALGTATAAQYLFGIDLGIDQLLFSAATDTPRSATPGRMAAVTAIAFLLTGAALAFVGIETRRGRRPAQPLAVAAGALALAALLGYIYGAIAPVGPGQGIQIAVHTAIGIVLLSAGTLSLEVHAGWLPTLLSRQAGGELARRLLPLAFAVPVALGGLRHFGRWTGSAKALDDAAVVAVLTMLAFASVIWWTARAVNKADAHWRAAEQDRLTQVAQAEAAREHAEAERAGRESAERAVREKDEALTLLDLVLDSTPVGFALLDRDLRIRRLNSAFAAMTGAAVGDNLQKTIGAFVPDRADAVEAEYRNVLATGEPIINRERTTTATGTRREQHFLSSKYAVRSREGDIIGIGVTLVETTDRKHLEAQLQQSQKMQAIGQLAGGVAHDFNNVLAAIKCFSELVAVELPPESELRGDVGEITAAADRGAALTRQLLAFSRQQRLEPAVIDPNAVVLGVTRLLTRLIGAEIRCEKRLAPALGHVLVDPGQLEQVLVNLAVNARDAMPNGGTLTIETGNITLDAQHANALAGVEAAHPGDYVVLTVSDTGVGMDRATVSRIFEPFFTTKESGKGTGLGLSTVYGIVRQSAGYVSVYSEMGLGTTFRVYLPRIAAAVSLPPLKSSTSGPQHGSETILLVDDDDAVRTVLTRVLTRAGFTVLAATSPREAESIWTEYADRIHLLVTDLMMPDMNGGELAQRMLAAHPETRVLYTSGYTNEAVIKRGMIRPDVPFLSKPFSIDAVVPKVREALS